MKGLPLTMGSLFGRTLATLALTSMSAFANVDFNFLCISNATNCQNNVGNQLNVNVSQATATTVAFKFTNKVGIASSITDIYFDQRPNGSLLAPSMTITDSGAGVDFGIGASPANLPGGNPAGFNADFSADSNPPVSQNGVNTASEFVTITLALASGRTFNQVINALNSNALDIGLHIQALPGGRSASYLSHIVVPEPGSYAALLGGLGGVMWLVRRKRTA